ncbi:unnamed protein product [Meganyctiphanes norvegica]|uniref:TLC domain-containing protein n=1 Tax=Meganyctiphanes norvegica TaxID=48144 RepID=A0AAV2PUQ5_MEGNR
MLRMEGQYAIGAYALAGWMALYLLISLALRCWNRTKDLSDLHRAHVTEGFVSGVQGIACGLVGLVIVYTCWHDVMGAKMNLAFTYSSIGTAYFYYDLWAMYYSNSLKLVGASFIKRFISYLCSQPLMIAHHMVIIVLLFPAMVYHSPMGHFFVGCFFCTELSTPFVNARIIMSRIGLKSSKIYIANGFLMLILFSMCRVALFPIMYAVYLSQQTKTPSHIQALIDIPIKCHLSCAVVLAPQLYWLNLMVRGAVTILKKDAPTALMEKYD